MRHYFSSSYSGNSSLDEVDNSLELVYDVGPVQHHRAIVDQRKDRRRFNLNPRDRYNNERAYREKYDGKRWLD